MSKYIPNVNQLWQVLKIDRRTAKQYSESDWFPKKRKTGWPLDEVVAAVKAYQEANEDDDEDSGIEKRLKNQKLVVQIQRLEVGLKQDNIEYDRVRDLLSPTLDHQNEVKQLLREIKMCVDSFRKSETARVRKPAEKKLIDGVCDKVLNHMAGQVERYVVKHGIGGDHCESSGGEE